MFDSFSAADSGDAEGIEREELDLRGDLARC
jgi:hypothetical protein